MSYIEELRQRVESAERRFGLIDEQERRYSERLIGLMNALEAGQEERQAEAAAHRARIADLERENGELRGMLHALLLGVEAGSRDTLAGTLRDLDARLSGLVRPAQADRETAPDETGGEDAAADVDAALVDTCVLPDDGAAETQAEEIPAKEVAAEDIMLDEEADDAIETIEEDAVAAAEQAVAELLSGGAEGGADMTVAEEFAMEGAAADAMPAGDATGDQIGSPVADMIERLADETQDFAAGELSLDEAPAEEAAEDVPEPAAKPARQQA